MTIKALPLPRLSQAINCEGKGSASDSVINDSDDPDGLFEIPRAHKKRLSKTERKKLRKLKRSKANQIDPAEAMSADHVLPSHATATKHHLLKHDNASHTIKSKSSQETTVSVNDNPSHLSLKVKDRKDGELFVSHRTTAEKNPDPHHLSLKAAPSQENIVEIYVGGLDAKHTQSDISTYITQLGFPKPLHVRILSTKQLWRSFVVSVEKSHADSVINADWPPAITVLLSCD